jgi:hypothetical protein
MVMAVIISAMMYAAAAVTATSCTWMDEVWASYEKGSDKADEPEIPMDEVLSVEDLLAGEFAGDTVWVRGFIVGGLLSDGTVDFSCGEEVLGTVVVLADDVDCDDEEDCMVLHLTKKAHKEELGLDQAAVKSKIYHQQIYVQGKVASHKGFTSLTNLCNYKLE